MRASCCAADGDEGGRHQLITASVSNGNLYILKIQVRKSMPRQERLDVARTAPLPAKVVINVMALHTSAAAKRIWLLRACQPAIGLQVKLTPHRASYCFAQVGDKRWFKGVEKDAKGAWNSFTVA